jgi:predicted RNA-binding Zn-ribbon protein involved in translation (DUF1610 family)
MSKRKRKYKYRCPHCGKIVIRESTKQWVESYCEATGRNVRLQRVSKRKGK